jgi:hypothetical protein
MATYFKYAERSAESQVNWAEIGKNMTDMLKEENRLREEKKAALEASSREYGEYLSNIPAGEHQSARQAGLEFGDSASQYMLLQDRLLKQGLLQPKDFMISRQNLIDDTKSAFGSLKQFQEEFSKRMERARTDKSALYELRKMEQIQGFGNWRESGFYINPTTGNVSVAMKTEKEIDGKKVFTMDEKPGKTASIAYIKGLLQGQWDKYNTNEVTTALAESLGKEETAKIVFGTLSKGGTITTEEDITKRVDLDEDGKTVMFKFLDWENQSIDAALTNEFDRASVLTDSKKFAPNGKQYDYTNDPQEAAKNPNLILEVIDPNTGQGTLQFSPEQIKVSQDFMRNELRAKYDYKKGIDTTPQAQAQYPPQYVMEAQAEAARIAAGGGVEQEAAQPEMVSVPLGAITEESGAASETLKSSLPSNFTVVDNAALGLFGNEIIITAPDGITTYTYTSRKSTTAADIIKKDIEDFVRKNRTAPAAPANAGTATTGAALPDTNKYNK